MCGFRSTFPNPQYFLKSSNKLLRTVVISSHMEEKQSMYRLKSLKEKTLSLHLDCRDERTPKSPKDVCGESSLENVIKSK